VCQTQSKTARFLTVIVRSLLSQIWREPAGIVGDRKVEVGSWSCPKLYMGLSKGSDHIDR